MLSFLAWASQRMWIANKPAYWRMMQIAMIRGYVTALPVNWLLIKIG